MPRLPKWLLLREWLTVEDVTKVYESAPSELENVLSRDESDEFGHSYKFVCTFCPRQCQTEYRVYRFESSARLGMRNHLKDHIKSLVSGDQAEFLTRNQLYQQTKGQKHKLAISKSEAPPAKIVKTSSRAKSSVSGKSSPVPETSEKRKRFTRIKRVISNENEYSKSLDEVVLEKEVTSSPSPTCDDKMQGPIEHIKEETEVAEILNDLPSEELVEEKEEDQDFDSKISCETQTDHGGKEVETLQYKIATRLFAVDRSQWSNIKQVLDEIIRGESTSEEIIDDDKVKILEGMAQWIESVKIYDQQTVTKLQDPLTPTEESILNSMTTEDWRKLDTAHDSESKLRLTVYARLLLRDYEWYPRKLKPKVCRHCQKHYTASTSLYSHLVSLSGIRFWVCSKCKDASKEEATFTRKHSLQYHILKEVGIPRYRCSQPGCNKTHNHTHHQKSHARQHTGEKHYICEIEGCKGQFSNRNTYSRHLLQFHSTELTRGNQLREIDEKEAQLKVFAARLKARERSKCKRQRYEGGNPEVEPERQTVEQRALTRLLCNKQNETSPNASNLGLVDIEKFMRPSASQLLCGIARDVRNTTSTIEGSGKSSDSMLGGLNLLATVSKYMNAENCEDDAIDSPECHGKEQFVKKSTGSYTKLIEALDISQSSLWSSPESYNPTNRSNQIPIISSLDTSVKKSGCEKLVLPDKSECVSEESATTKPSKLLPFPIGQNNNNKDESKDLEGPKLPNVIQGLKNRLMNAPKYVLPSPSVSPNIIKTSTLQTASMPNQLKSGTGKIIVNLSQVQPVCTSASLSEIEKPRGNISTLNTSFNSVSKEVEDQNSGSNTVVTPSMNRNSSKTLQFRTLTGFSGKTYIVLASANNVTECYPVPTETQPGEKTIPFSQL